MLPQAEKMITLRMNLADYPVTRALKSGQITSDIVKLDFCGPKVAHDGFKPMIRENAFDAGELAIVTYLQAKAYAKPYVLLPISVLGRFQHHCVAYSKEFGHLDPKDIEGRRVGVRTYAQTTGLWVRGILQHEYGVDLDKVTWMTIDDGHLLEYADPPNCERLPKGASIPDMLLRGELAAAILGMDMPKDERLRTLIQEPQTAAGSWYEREKVIPINHMIGVHAELSRRHPDVVREIFRLVLESAAAAPAADVPLPLPVSLEANRRGLEMAIDWSYEQKIIPRRFTVDELFDDCTAQLGA
jgi:4,5-dihydroxyphthalate decarboxylase